jgi:signal transduction histidine kinase/ligand-binding sensor domain-containing protein
MTFRFVVAVLLALCCSRPVQALDAEVPLTQLHHDMWTARDGMPGDVYNMTQSTDGWLWFAATSGLYRFDGVRFERMRALGGVPLASQVITAVRAFSDGSLWIGYRYGGLSVYQGGRLRHYGPSDGYEAGPVFDIDRDRQGRTWSINSNGLYRLHGTRWRRAGEDAGLPGSPRGMLADGTGRLWVTTETALYVLGANDQRFTRTEVAGARMMPFGDRHGRIWIDHGGRLERLPENLAGPAGPVAAQPASASPRLFDRDGNLWVAGCEGLCRVAASRIGQAQHVAWLPPSGERIQNLPEVSSASTLNVLEDREGNIWVSTRRGLDRYRHDRLLRIPLVQGMDYAALAVDGDGQPWTAGGIRPVLQRWRTDSGVPSAAVTAAGADISTLAVGIDGALLVGRSGRVERRRQEVTATIALPKPAPGSRETAVRALLDTPAGLWANLSRGSVYRYAAGEWTPGTALGLPDLASTCMGLGPDGAIWFGYRGDALVSLHEGVVRRYGPSDGLAIGIAGILYAAGSDLLAAGDNGLAVFRNGRFQRIQTADPDVLTNISGIVRTPDGDLWLNGGKGLVRIRTAAWTALLRSLPAVLVDYELFDSIDGYPGAGHFRLGKNSLALDGRGGIWVSGTDGVAWLDPRRLRRNDDVPPVAILSVTAGQQNFAPSRRVELPAGSQDVQISYTALSFTLPERVRFQYRLEGVDASWRDAKDRRTAYYTNLGPGTYRFRVKAANEDGTWNEQGASVDLTIAPTFTQSLAFRLICVILAVMLVSFLVWLWFRRSTRQLRALLLERASERERIARILHDTLLQSVQSLLLVFGGAYKRLPADSPDRERLAASLRLADRTVKEGIEEVRTLRGTFTTGDDLIRTLTVLGETLSEQFGPRFSLHVEGSPRALRRDVANEIAFIAREGLHNAYRHARATAVGVDIVFGDDAFVLRVHDDGMGMDASRAGAEGHWGLIGMRERAVGIQAALTVSPGEYGGTVITLRVLARDVYKDPRGSRWWERFGSSRQEA